MKAKWIGVGVLTLALGVLIGTLGQGQSVPQLINYQGRLTDAGGVPINGVREMHFALLDSDTTIPPATLLWGETQSSVQVSQGIYNVMLGSVNPVPASALSGATVYLEVTVAGETLLPRQRVTSVAYSLRASEAVNAQQLGGQPSGDYYSKAQVDALLSGLQAQIDSLSGQVTTNTGDIAALDGRVTTNEGNIATLDTRVDLNDTDILALQGDMTVAQADIANHESWLDAIETKLQPVTVSLSGSTVTDFILTNVNVHVRSGSGSTNGVINGRGNLIVGYNENSMTYSRTGSHNLIVGADHGYTSYGGLVAGYRNRISNMYASISGGSLNQASGAYASISSGYSNLASNNYSSVSGGSNNTASGQYASVSGGYYNSAGFYSSVSGGASNAASGWYSSVGGGASNVASGDYSSVAGGGGATMAEGNEAYSHYSAILGGRSNDTGDGALRTNGQYSTVSGGYTNRASGQEATVSGGRSNTAASSYGSVSAGYFNTASGQYASVSGGSRNIASGNYSSVAGGGGFTAAEANEAYSNYSAILGGRYNDTGDGAVRTNGQYSTVSGGSTNRASGQEASVSGGYNRNTAPGQYDWAAGGSWQDE